jgi:hypothetical protein
MRKIFWVLTLCATVLGLANFIRVVLIATDPVKQVSGIGISLAVVIIPYVFTRCLEGMRRVDVLRVRIVGNERPMLMRESRGDEPSPVMPDAPPRERPS